MEPHQGRPDPRRPRSTLRPGEPGRVPRNSLQGALADNEIEAALAVRAIRTSRCRAGRRRTAARAQVLRSRDLRGADRTCSCSAAASNGRWETVNALFLSTRRWLARHVAAGLLLVTGGCLAVGGILHVAGAVDGLMWSGPLGAWWGPGTRRGPCWPLFATVGWAWTSSLCWPWRAPWLCVNTWPPP